MCVTEGVAPLHRRLNGVGRFHRPFLGPRVVNDGGAATPMQQRFAEHMERLEAEYDRLLDRMREVEDMLAEHLVDLSDIEQAIIVERYMHNKSWRQIEREYEYSIDSIFRLHHTAVTKISKSQQ